MNTQQPVAAGLMPAPAPGVSQQQQGIFQSQQQPSLRAAQTQQYFAANQPQAMRPARYPMGPTGQPNQMYQMYGPYIGQTQNQGFPASVMVQQQGQMIGYPSQRMPSPQYTIPNSQAIQQIAAQYPQQPSQQFAGTQQYQAAVYYQGQSMPLTQPQRPPSASGSSTGTLQKRERKPIPIIDPNSGQQVTTEGEGAPAKSTPPGGSDRNTPVNRPVTDQTSPTPLQMQNSDIAAQFAAQVAATLGKTSGGAVSGSPELTTDNEQMYPQPDSYEEVPPEQTNQIPTDAIQADVNMSDSAPMDSCVDVPPTEMTPELVAQEPVPQESAAPEVESSVDYVPSRTLPSTDELASSSSPVDAVAYKEPSPVAVEASNLKESSPAPSDTASHKEPSPALVDKDPSPAPEVVFKEPSPVVEEAPDPTQQPTVDVHVPPPQVVPVPEVPSMETVSPVVTVPDVSVPVKEVVDVAEKEEPTPTVVSVAEIAKEQTPPPTENTEADEEPASAGSSSGKDANKKGKKKLRDLNRKGDEKEGTDMDAFLDPESVQPEATSDIVKAPVVAAEVKVEVEKPRPEPVNNVAGGKENEMPKVEIEIKNSEHAEVSRKNAKNDEKTNDTSSSKSEPAVVNSVEKPGQQLKYKYKEDQWSPLNPEGKMQYDRDFLLQLQYSKDSMKKPDMLPNFPEIIPDKMPQKGMDMRSGGGFHVPDFTPGFIRPSRGMPGGGGSGSMGKNRSQQRNRGDVKVIKINSSLQQDVKLHHAENAWKPGHKDAKDIEDASADLYKKVRSILNKLTPQKFQTLIKQVQGLVIDTESRLKGVTDIIFEKAISEPAFSVAYANMCRYLLTLKVPSETKPGESVNFRVILLTRCQREFEKDNDVQLDLDKRKKAIEEAETEEQKATLKEELNLVATTARRRSIGNIRFIGELFKLKMLTENIMHDCVFKLLRSRDEENLECLCRLLSTIGKELESDKAKPRMDQYFQQMKKIVADKKVSSRCRFMLQDVVDLRSNAWKPRRDENNPKTIDQIHRDAKREEVEDTMLRAMHMATQQQQQQQPQHHQPRHKSGRGRPGQGGGGGSGGSMDEGWNTVSSKAIRNIDRNIDVSKLRISKNVDEQNIQLGPAGGRFGGWGRGSSGGGSRASQESERPNTPANRFSALSNKEDDQRSRAFGRGASPARGDTRTRGSASGFQGGFQKGKVINRSSQESERERAVASTRNFMGGRSTPPSEGASREGSRNRSSKPERPAQPVKEISEEEMEKKTHSIIDEYLHIQDRKEAIQCVSELNSPKTIHFFVYFAINHVLERSQVARQQTGHLLHDLINQKVISVDTYLQGLTEILQAAEDMEIDIPKIWQYLGELIGPMIQDGSVPLSFLCKACEPLKPAGKAGILMAEVLHDASQRLGHKIVAHLWRNNCMDWSSFVPQDKIQSFLKEKNLEFTVGPDSAPSTPTSKVSIEWIQQNLSDRLLKPSCDNEHIFDWIEANVPDDTTKEARFIRALMTAVCSSAIIGTGNASKVDQEVVKKRRALLQKYLDHQAEFELQALYALQALVHSLEHPPGVLRTFFDTLYDEEIISEDAFNQWETSREEPEGKGVALKQVVQFFAWLREGEEEEADS